MKKCPYCNATLDDTSRFCLYCMTSLDKKIEIEPKNNKKHPLLLIISLIIILSVAGIIVFFPKIFSSNNSNSSTPPNKEKVKNTTSLESSIESLESSIESSVESSAVSDKNAISSEAENTNNSEISSDIYLFEAAQPSNDFDGTYEFPKDSIVITGVKSPAKNGIYSIPETINGKTVVAVMHFAFAKDKVASTIKQITIPSTVKTVWSHAFSGCYNLTDIYVCGNEINISMFAYPTGQDRNKNLTIHTSENCSNRDGSTLKSDAIENNITFNEWDKNKQY